MTRIKVGLFFGGRSTEHEVSVISALQAFTHFDKEKYEIIPIYISKDGRFFSDPKLLDLKNYKDLDSLLLSSPEVNPDQNKNLKGLSSKSFFKKFINFDIAFPIFHGSFGEDGAIQGLFELYQTPYVGFGVLGSAVAMDKVLSKYLFKSLGLNVANYYSFHRRAFQENPEKIVSEIKKVLNFPMFVKPVTGGSSIGANKAKNPDELQFNIEVAAIYSEKVIVEEAFEGLIEVNCSALGYGGNIEASVCEMPVSSGDLLSFEDKYKKGPSKSSGHADLGLKESGMASLSRVIPAPISSNLTKDIQDTTIKVFQAIDGCGVARIDYFVDVKKEKFWINEVNSPPGSLSFYLWEPKGVKFPELLDRLIESGFERFKEQGKTQYTFESGLLSPMADKGGLKR